MAAEPSPVQRGHDRGRTGLAGDLRCHQATLWPFSFRALSTQKAPNHSNPAAAAKPVSGWEAGLFGSRRDQKPPN
jgi:hypothetical protein